MTTVQGPEGGPAPGPPTPRSVLVRVGATAAQLPPLRVVAGDLAARADLDLDAVADLRLAVDEAAAELVIVAAPGSDITCTFVVADDGVEATVTVPAAPATELRSDSFGWRVLSMLVDEVHLLDNSDDGRRVLGIVMIKARSGPGSSHR